MLSTPAANQAALKTIPVGPILSLVGCSTAEPTSFSDRYGIIQNKKLLLQAIKIPNHFPNLLITNTVRGMFDLHFVSSFFKFSNNMNRL